MQRHSITPIRIKKVKIAFSKNMMTAYTGLSRMDSLYTGTGGNRTVQEHSPNSMSVYSKIIMYISIAYASTDRFVHMGCLGTKHSLQLYSGYKGCPRQQHLLRGFSTRSRAFTMRISILQPLVYLVQLIQRECRVYGFYTTKQAKLSPAHSVPEQNNCAICFGDRSGNATLWNTFFLLILCELSLTL